MVVQPTDSCWTVMCKLITGDTNPSFHFVRQRLDGGEMTISRNQLKDFIHAVWIRMSLLAHLEQCGSAQFQAPKSRRNLDKNTGIQTNHGEKRFLSLSDRQIENRLFRFREHCKVNEATRCEFCKKPGIFTAEKVNEATRCEFCYAKNLEFSLLKK